MRGNVHPEWVPQHVAIHYSLLGHLFKVHIPIGLCRGYSLRSNLVLSSGDAFSVFSAIRFFFIINVMIRIILFCFAGHENLWNLLRFLLSTWLSGWCELARESLWKSEMSVWENKQSSFFVAGKRNVGRRLNETSLRRVQHASKRSIKVIRFWGFKVMRAMQRASKRSSLTLSSTRLLVYSFTIYEILQNFVDTFF